MNIRMCRTMPITMASLPKRPLKIYNALQKRKSLSFWLAGLCAPICHFIFPTLCTLANLEIPETVQGKNFVSLLNHPEKLFRKNVYTRFGPGDTIVTKDFAYTSYTDKTAMLYDHRNDPDENSNVVNMTEYKESVAQMTQWVNPHIQ